MKRTLNLEETSTRVHGTVPGWGPLVRALSFSSTTIRRSRSLP